MASANATRRSTSARNSLASVSGVGSNCFQKASTKVARSAFVVNVAYSFFCAGVRR
jgi:hypothetical protein